jgi:hypothetical protein
MTKKLAEKMAKKTDSWLFYGIKKIANNVNEKKLLILKFRVLSGFFSTFDP